MAVVGRSPSSPAEAARRSSTSFAASAASMARRLQGHAPNFVRGVERARVGLPRRRTMPRGLAARMDARVPEFAGSAAEGVNRTFAVRR